MYLVDTDVISVLRRPERHPQVAAWFGSFSTERFFVSVITFGELKRGIDAVQRTDAVFAQELIAWLANVMEEWRNRTLFIDTAIALRWGGVSATIGNKNADLLIAATALEHGLTVVTRNVSDFGPTGVRLVNPFDI